MRKLLFGLMLTVPMAASAIEVTVDNVVCTELPAVCNALTQEVKDKVNEDLPEVSIDKYGDGISNSTSFATKGMSSEYADNFDLFSIKASVGAAAQGDISEPEDAEGIGIGAAVSVGLNLGVLPVKKIAGVDLEDIDVFMSFMSYSVDQDKDDTNIKGDLKSFGLHFRWRFLEEKSIVPGHMVSWGGVQVHTGFMRNSMEIDATQSFEDETVETGTGETATFGNASAAFTIDSSSTSIPVEISTNIRLLYAFTFYAGAGFDYTIAKTDVELNADGTVSGDGGTNYSADINANESGDGAGEATNFRAFLGAQLNFPVFKIYVHANKGLGNDLLGANAGFKINW